MISKKRSVSVWTDRSKRSPTPEEKPPSRKREKLDNSDASEGSTPAKNSNELRLPLVVNTPEWWTIDLQTAVGGGEEAAVPVLPVVAGAAAIAEEMNSGGSATVSRQGGLSNIIFDDTIKINRSVNTEGIASQFSSQNCKIESSKSAFDQKSGSEYGFPVLTDINDVLIPPEKKSKQIVSVNQVVRELANFSNYFSNRDLEIADMLWHSATTGSRVEFQQNIVSMIYHMRHQKLKIESLEERLQVQSTVRFPEMGQSASPQICAGIAEGIIYSTTFYEVLLQVPLANPIVTSQSVLEKILALNWAKKFVAGEYPDGIVPIEGYLSYLPIGKINEPTSSKEDRDFLFRSGLIGQILVSRNLEEIDFLGTEISSQIKAAMKGYLPFNIFSWVSSPDEQTPGFCLLRVTNIEEDTTSSDIPSVSEIEPFDLDQDDMSKQRYLAIQQIAGRLQDNTQKWYTLYQAPGCIIQTSNPYNGLVETQGPPKQLKIPATMLDCTCIGFQDQNTADKVKIIVPPHYETRLLY